MCTEEGEEKADIPEETRLTPANTHNVQQLRTHTVVVLIPGYKRNQMLGCRWSRRYAALEQHRRLVEGQEVQSRRRSRKRGNKEDGDTERGGAMRAGGK